MAVLEGTNNGMIASWNTLAILSFIVSISDILFHAYALWKTSGIKICDLLKKTTPGEVQEDSNITARATRKEGWVE